MSTDIAIEELQPSTHSKCRHHWIIATPNGVTSRGVCKQCGTEREFPNAADDALQANSFVPRRYGAGPRDVAAAKAKADFAGDFDL